MWTYINNAFTGFTKKHKMIGKNTTKIAKNQSLRAVQGKVFLKTRKTFENYINTLFSSRFFPVERCPRKEV